MPHKLSNRRERGAETGGRRRFDPLARGGIAWCIAACLGLGLSLLATDPGHTQSSSDLYAKACREAIGAIPDFSCADGAVVPVTVDGMPVTPAPGQSCDRPALLDNGPQSDGQCVPYSRILSLSTKTMQVAVMCRQKKIRAASSLQYDELDIVAHNPTSGATCWFQASPSNGQPIDGSHVPSPTAQNVGTFWNDPATTAHDGCGMCHDAGPVMYSPFVGQVWQTLQVDPFGPYFHVDPDHFGFDRWPTWALNPRDNSCLGCHRIGVGETCGSLTRWMSGLENPPGADMRAKSYPLSHAMPPAIGQTLSSWDQVYAMSVSQIRSCCQKPDQPACNKTKISGAPPG
jgi:hypothetical protein